MEFIDTVATYLPLLLKGAVVTVSITIMAFCVAVIIGFILGALLFQLELEQYNHHSYWRWFALFIMTVYIRIFKGIPALTLLFFIYFALPAVGYAISSIPAAVIGLGLIGSAMLAEVFRSGLTSIHKGQREAAIASGMNMSMILHVILLPQSWRLTLPSIANYAIGLLKDTAVVAAVAAPEIMFYARNIVTENFNSGSIYCLVAIIYFVLSFPLARLADYLEKHVNKGRR